MGAQSLDRLPPQWVPNQPGHLQIGNHMAVSLIVLAAMAAAQGPKSTTAGSCHSLCRAAMVGTRRKARAWHHASFAWGLLCHCGQSRLGCVHLET